MSKDFLVCDFHIHTNNSDGELTVTEVVDLFGKNNLDAIAISDHMLDGPAEKRMLDLGASYAVTKDQFPGYIKTLQQQAARAIDQYKMLVIPSIEFTNNKGGYHIVAVDIKEYIDPGLPPEKIIDQIHSQNAIAIAPHPYRGIMDGTGDLMYMWDNREKFKEIIDAWEVANRKDMFDKVGEYEYNYVANSDFHYPYHLYSWKTVLRCEKNIDAIKTAIRDNDEVSIKLFKKEAY